MADAVFDASAARGPRSLSCEESASLAVHRRWSVGRMHGARGAASAGERNGNYQHAARTNNTVNATRYENALTRLVSKTAAEIEPFKVPSNDSGETAVSLFRVATRG